MSVGRICTREVDLASTEESAQAAATRMHDRKVGTLVVLDDQQRPVGILTDRDLALRIVGAGLYPQEVAVEEVMTQLPTVVQEETPIEEALAIMRNGPFRRVPVVDDDGRLVGLLSIDDVVCLLSEEFRQIDQLLQGESPGSLGRR